MIKIELGKFQVKEAVSRAEAAEKKAYEGHLDSQDALSGNFYIAYFASRYREPCKRCKTCKSCFRCTEGCTQAGFCGRKCGRQSLPETMPWVWSG